MSNSWEAVQRKAARKAQTTASASSAGEYAEAIGAFAGLNDVHVDSHDFGETAEERRFDVLTEVLAKKVPAALARQLARDVIACDGRADVAAVAGAVCDVVGGVSLEERIEGKFRALFFEAKNARLPVLQIRVIMMALGWADERVESMRRCADDYQMSPEAISNMVEAVQRRHLLPKSHFNKSATMVATYKKTNARA